MKNALNPERLDTATSARLAKLAARPVDTARLEGRLERAMAEQTASATPPAAPGWRFPDASWWRPLTAAAMILIAVTLGILALNGGESPAMAAPAQLAQIHYDVVNGLAPRLRVSSVAEANRLLADQSSGVVPMPDLPGVMQSCCLHAYEGTTLTCAVIRQGEKLISVAVADGAKMRSPAGPTITRDGRRFITHSANGINMVMAQRGNRWLCVMGEVDLDRLADMAAGIEF